VEAHRVLQELGRVDQALPFVLAQIQSQYNTCPFLFLQFCDPHLLQQQPFTAFNIRNCLFADPDAVNPGSTLSRHVFQELDRDIHEPCTDEFGNGFA